VVHPLCERLTGAAARGDAERVESRADKDAEAIDTLSKALTKATDNNSDTVKVLESLREALERK